MSLAHQPPPQPTNGPRIGSLCTGYGGLDLAVEQVLGGQLAWYAEVDRHAQAVLAHRFPGVVNLGDIRTVDWDTVAPVDVVTAGFPCQNYSEHSVIPITGRRDARLPVMRLGGSSRSCSRS